MFADANAYEYSTLLSTYDIKYEDWMLVKSLGMLITTEFESVSFLKEKSKMKY